MTKKEIMQSATELKGTFTFEEACDKLEQAKATGENIYITWYSNMTGEKFYSLIDDRESFCQKVHGKSYADYQAAELRGKMAREEKRRAAIEAIPARIERGLALIDQNQDQWEEAVESRSKGRFFGHDIDHALDIIEQIKNGDFESAYNIFIGSGHSGGSFALVSGLISAFCSEGDSFLDYVYEQQHGLGNA